LDPGGVFARRATNLPPPGRASVDELVAHGRRDAEVAR
jgi:hypothetical protein